MVEEFFYRASNFIHECKARDIVTAVPSAHLSFAR